VLEFGFQLDFIVYVCLVHHMCADFDLCKILVVLDLLERSCCISCGTSVCNIQLNQ